MLETSYSATSKRGVLHFNLLPKYNTENSNLLLSKFWNKQPPSCNRLDKNALHMRRFALSKYYVRLVKGIM